MSPFQGFEFSETSATQGDALGWLMAAPSGRNRKDNSMTSESGTTQSESIEFEFDGHRVRAESGQSVAGALHAAGEHIVSRSFKYHRPRGLLCMSGRCPNCICTVDGTPNVRICTQAAKPGMVVKSQNAWPSVKFDLLRIFDKLHRFMPVGFYYKRMYKPRWMWPVWEKIIRRIAGLGTINREHGADGVYDKQNLFTDVAVIGGGLAGLRAALASAEAGVTVTLIDEQSALGGHLRHDPDLGESLSASPAGGQALRNFGIGRAEPKSERNGRHAGPGFERRSVERVAGRQTDRPRLER